MNRVVVTGMGITSPLGTGVETFWSNLTAGNSGISHLDLFDASTFPVRIGGQVRDCDFSVIPRRFSNTEQIRDRKVKLGLIAAEEALSDSHLSPTDLNEAVLITGVGLEYFDLSDLTPYAHCQDMAQALTTRLPEDMGPNSLQTPLDTLSTHLGQRYGFSAGKYVNCSACAAGAQVVGQAFEMIHCGQTDCVVAGATDSMLNPLGLGGFSLLRVLSDDNDNPTRAWRPVFATPTGPGLGEGAAFVVMESLDVALKRKARIYAEVLGYGSSMDAFRISDPDSTGQGACHSMSRALQSANLRPSEIHGVNAHGTGTLKNDAIETAAIKEVLGKHAYAIPVHAVKSMTGHLIAASGTVETIVSALTLCRRIIPPTKNLTEPDPACDLDYVPEGSRPFDGHTILSNSFGFGGQNATLIFGRVDCDC
jgi:3-oxoacyl-[acyl-carrier-protein] synthase II